MTRLNKPARTAQPPSSAGEHRRAIAKHIEQLSHRHNRWNVFSDFVELSAISISNAVDFVERERREARYHEITKRYVPEEMDAFPEMLAELVLALDCGFDDVLGKVFHDLELHNKYQGQFFTPYELCKVMAATIVGDRDSVHQTIAERGFITVLEPACGGGAMLIAAAEVLKDAGVNYQQHLHATAVDVDLKCVHMAYVQLALLHVPAIVVHGNSLTLEEHSHWRTPAHLMGGWSWKLRRAASPPTIAAEPDAKPIHIGEQLSLLEGAA